MLNALVARLRTEMSVPLPFNHAFSKVICYKALFSPLLVRRAEKGLFVQGLLAQPFQQFGEKVVYTGGSMPLSMPCPVDSSTARHRSE